MKTLLLSIFLCVFFANTAFSLTNTYIGANGDWNTATNWSTGAVPVASDDVIIPSGVSVNISASSYANSISLSGTLTVNDGIRLTVYNNFTVNLGGSFLMPGGSALSTLVVYGNYINNGSTDFWKSTVVIVGDLISSATSELQKQGNVVVGGNIIGDFDLTGGTGTGQIYAVNPNATVTITPTSIDNNVTPGTQVVNPPETQTLVDLVNEVIYGGTCPFSITNPTSVAACSGNTKTFSVVASGSAFAYVYQWQVNSGSGWIDLSDVAPYSNTMTATLTITGITVAMDKYKYRIKITSNGCSKNSNYGTLSVSASAPSTPGTISGLTTQCKSNPGQVYSVAAVAGATSYIWTVSPDTGSSKWLITNGQGTNVIMLTTGTVDGVITVAAVNGCGSSVAQTLNVAASTSPTAPTAPVPSSATGITCSQFIANWAVSANATSYILEVSTGNGGGNGAGSFNLGILSGYSNLNVGNVNSYIVTLLNQGTQYYYRVRAVNICTTSVNSSLQSVTTSSSTLGTLPTITGAVTVCASNSGLVYSITTVTNATNYFWAVPSGWAITSGQGTISVTVTSGTSGGNVTVSVGNDCISSSNIDKVVTVSAIPVAPTATATSQPTCVVPTGAITVTAPIGMNYSIDGSDYSNSTGFFPGVAVGAYSVTAKNASGCISLGAPVSIIAPITNTWNGSVWSKTGDTTPPSLSDALVFAGLYSLSGDLNGCSCVINSGVAVTIKSGDTLTITNTVVNNGGTLTFEDDATLLQINDVANTGSIIYKRTTTPILSTDYTYWSSPVYPQTLYNVSPQTASNKFYYRDAVNNLWVRVSSATVMEKGIGYIIRGPLTAPYSTSAALPYTASFEGVPNNGAIIAVPTVVLNKNYLIGNPYPSAISATTFLQKNSFIGTLFFWTHNTAITANKYTTDDYATFNLSGGTGSAPSGSTGGANNAIPSGNIAAGQGFFASVVSSPGVGNIFFDNSMRIDEFGAVVDNSQFFKMGANTKTASKSSAEKHRIWLNLTNSGGIFKQTLVAYLKGATNEYDYQYDGGSFNANAYADFYSVNTGRNLAIQGRALPFENTDLVPLGYRSAITGNFEISIDKVEGALINQTVFLEDKTTKTIHNLKNGPYSFSTLAGTFNDRFVLRYVEKTGAGVEKPMVVNRTQVVSSIQVLDASKVVDVTVGTADFETTARKVIVSVKNHQIKINSFEETIAKVLVYDLGGSLLYEKADVNSNEFSVQNLGSASQFLVVQVLLKNGTWVTEEIVF